MEAEELKTAIGKMKFLLLSDKFIEASRHSKRVCLSFETEEDAKQFLLKFLVLECISGSTSREDLMLAYEKIRKWVMIGRSISSEELPIGRHKTHEQKNLIGVMYYVSNTDCCYMKL